MEETSKLHPIAGPSIKEAEVDIVFLHGLQSTFDGTWSGDHSSIIWPQDLLPKDIPGARIFAYDYSFRNASVIRPDDASRDLTQSLKALAEQNAGLPIVFVAHSLGGLILQDVLLKESKLIKSSILMSASGIIFLGTPRFQREEEWSRFRESVSKITKATGLPDARALTRLGRDSMEFASWLKTPSAATLATWSFYESLPVYRMGILVPREWAVIVDDQSSPLQSDHFRISRCDSVYDAQYQAIRYRLKCICDKSKAIEDIGDTGPKRIGSIDNHELIIDAVGEHEPVRRDIKLALALEDQGHPEAAETVYDEAIEEWTKSHSSESPVVWFCLWKKSTILRDRGNFSKAKNLCMQVKEAAPVKDVLYLQSLGNLALIMRAQRQLDQAYTILRHTLERVAVDPYQDIFHVQLVSILGTVLNDLGDSDIALLLARDVLLASGALLGSTDPYTLDQASRLSLVLSDQGHFGLAEEIDRRSLDALEMTFGTNHPRSLQTAIRLANNLRYQGRYEDAVKISETTLKAQEVQLGPSHRSTISTKYCLAVTYSLQGRWMEAEMLFTKVIHEYTNMFGEDHPNTVSIRQALKIVADAIKSTDLESEVSDKINEIFKWRPSPKQAVLMSYNPEKFPELKLGPADVNEALRVAAMKNDNAAFDAALRGGAKQESVGGFCGTALHAACFSGNEKIVNKLLRSKANPNVQGGIFGTPLRAASFSGHVTIVQMLLESGADPNTTGNHGSALQAALLTNHRDVFRILLKAGADPNKSDSWYGTALHEASMAGQQHMVDILLEEKAKPNITGGVFGTALGASAWKGSVAITESLIKHGADVEAFLDGRNALYIALAAGNKDVVAVLVKRSTGFSDLSKDEKNIGPTKTVQNQDSAGSNTYKTAEVKPKKAGAKREINRSFKRIIRQIMWHVQDVKKTISSHCH
ncbi:hypothetical protein GJ744_005052 [Endocarpon pusillum]|uniref:AB hydrolase-1 domain-containing protein n=1 Tax=Endocarpon pusillum TaxID=364733 RepID=A0A8H7A615_9EURO|nr:hypothetical protein GJ744_005052 [Endocarpon pusillum]